LAPAAAADASKERPGIDRYRPRVVIRAEWCGGMADVGLAPDGKSMQGKRAWNPARVPSPNHVGVPLGAPRHKTPQPAESGAQTSCPSSRHCAKQAHAIGARRQSASHMGDSCGEGVEIESLAPAIRAEPVSHAGRSFSSHRTPRQPHWHKQTFVAGSHTPWTHAALRASHRDKCMVIVRHTDSERGCLFTRNM
jgi:hypothetical protein